MKTFMLPKEKVIRKWYLIDAQNIPLGRLSSQISVILRGKNKPEFSPHLDCGDFVIVINADKVMLSGEKINEKTHFYHTGYPGGARFVPYRKIMEEKPQKAIFLAVKGMLPKNKLRDKMLSRLKIYAGVEHPHQAQNPVQLNIGDRQE